jgi:DNA-binding SARP family transcriptional activator/tetratricopeptide (TPR) repeat protein
MAFMLCARLFGPLALEIDGRPVPEIGGLKPRSVLAWLLLHPRPHSRAQLAARFWPEVLDTSARASLRSALWALRAALEDVGGARYLDADRDMVGIAGDLPREIDTEEFDRLADSREVPDLEVALSLAEEPLLADLADDWVLEARDEFRERAGAAALRLAEKRQHAGDARAAVTWTRRALRHTRLSEEVNRALMRRLAEVGEAAQALRAYERFKAVLSAEFGTLPSPETRTLAADLRRTAAAGEGRRLSPSRIHVASRPDVPLAGRRDELNVLGQAFARARSGNGGIALVSGAAGQGKTRLVSELARAHEDQQFVVATGTTLELEGSPPLAPWLELLTELVERSEAPPAGVSWPTELARLVPAVEIRWGIPAAPAAPDPDLERARLFQAVIEGIDWCVGERTALLVLEDLHLADRATVTLLAAAGHRLTGLRALLVVTRRPTVTRELDAVLGRLARHGQLAAEVVLRRLSEQEIGTIVDSVAPGLPTERRLRAIGVAEGSPFLAREASRAAAADARFTDDFRDWTRAALAALPPPARLLAEIAACAGRPLDAAEAAEIVGGEQLPDALAAASERGLLEARGSRRIGFAHMITRAAVYDDLDESQRLRLHGRLADVLRKRPRPSVSEVARHLLLAQRETDARSYLAAAAARARALGALDEAAGFLREAAAAAEGNPTLGAELWLQLADVEAFRGRRLEHDDAFERGFALLEREGEKAALAEALVARGRWLRTTLCYPGEARAAYEEGLAAVDAQGLDAPELRALALAGIAWAEAASGDPRRAEALIEAAAALPEAVEDGVLAAELALAQATAFIRSGRFRESIEPSEHAAILALERGRVDLVFVALNTAASASASSGDFEGALRLADRARAAGRPGTALEAEALAMRAYALSRLGRHAEAREAVEQETDVLRRAGEPGEEALGDFDAGSIALAAGDHAVALARLQDALENEDGRVPRALARLRLAEARLGAGDSDGAAAELRRFPFEPVGRVDLPETLVPRLERLQALIAAAENDLRGALQRLAEAEAGWRRLLAAAPGDPFAASLIDLGRTPVAGLVEPAVELGRVLAERAALLAGRGELAEAAASAEEAADLARRVRFDGYDATLAQTRELLTERVRA